MDRNERNAEKCKEIHEMERNQINERNAKPCKEMKRYAKN